MEVIWEGWSEITVLVIILGEKSNSKYFFILSLDRHGSVELEMTIMCTFTDSYIDGSELR